MQILENYLKSLNSLFAPESILQITTMRIKVYKKYILKYYLMTNSCLVFFQPIVHWIIYLEEEYNNIYLLWSCASKIWQEFDQFLVLALKYLTEIKLIKKR